MSVSDSGGNSQGVCQYVTWGEIGKEVVNIKLTREGNRQGYVSKLIGEGRGRGEIGKECVSIRHPRGNRLKVCQ